MTYSASLPQTEAGRSIARTQGVENARGLAAMLLVVVVAVVGVLAEPLLSHWSDQQLLAGWMGLWTLACVGTLVLTGGAARLGRRQLKMLEPAQASA